MKVIYTETANIELDKFYKKQKKLLEKNIVEEKSIFGDEIIEVTSSDIKNAAENIIYINKKNNKVRVFERLSKIYFLIGVVITSLSFLYPYFNYFIQSESQKIGVIFGASMILFSAIIRVLFLDRRKLEKKSEHDSKIYLIELLEQIKKDNIELESKIHTELPNISDNFLKVGKCKEEHSDTKDSL